MTCDELIPVIGGPAHGEKVLLRTGLHEFPVFDLRRPMEIVGYRYSSYAYYVKGETFLRWCYRPADRISER
jgi:hypothetical protein